MNDDLENFHYNVIIASIYQMYSFLTKEIKKGFTKKTLVKNYKNILILINPILPHFSNECLEMININENIKWPTHDEKFLEDETKTVVIQINGKKKGLINTNKDLSEDELFNEIKKNEKIFKYISDNKIKKKIYVKNKIINFII